MIARYIFRQATSALILILLSLSGIVWIALALRQLNVVTAQGQDVWTLLAMTTLGLPGFVAVVAPVALFISAMHVLYRLSGDSEIIAITASGASTWLIARPILFLALLVAAGVSFANHVAVPWSMRMLGERVVQVRTDLLAQVMQPGQFTSPEYGLTLHIRNRGPDGTLEGLLIHDARNRQETLSLVATQGAIVKQGVEAYLVMRDGHILRRVDAGAAPQIIAFDRYAVDLATFERKIATGGDLKPRERYFGELVRPNPESASFRASPGQFRAELHERFASPFYVFAFALIALAAAGRAESTRQIRGSRIALAYASIVGIRLAGLAVNNVVVVTAWAVPLLYAIPIAACAGSVILISRSAQRSRASSAGLFPGTVARRLGDSLDLSVLLQRIGRRRRRASASPVVT